MERAIMKNRTWLAAISQGSLLLLLSAGCAVQAPPETHDTPGLEPSAGAGGDVGALAQAIVSGKQPRQTALYTWSQPLGTTLYEWAAENAPIIRMLPDLCVVTVANINPKNGYYQVVHAGTWGWIHGSELRKHHDTVEGLSPRRREALALAQSAMGFSYWWGHGRWVASGPTAFPVENVGECDGSCPKCEHWATGPEEYGADCSGFMSTIWGFWDTDPESAHDGFRTARFAKPHKKLRRIPIEEALTGDAVMYYDEAKQRGHIFMVGSPMDETGRLPSYECMGCEEGCRPNVRWKAKLGSWFALRRVDWPTY